MSDETDEEESRDPELELIETERLIKELTRRFEIAVFVGCSEHTDEVDEWCGCVSPSKLAGVGVMEAFKHKLLTEFHEDGPEPESYE